MLFLHSQLQTKLQIKLQITMKKMTLREFWQESGSGVKKNTLASVATKCQVSIDTVKAWMLGYRSPKGLNRDALLNFIKDNFNVEIIEKGGVR